MRPAFLALCAGGCDLFPARLVDPDDVAAGDGGSTDGGCVFGWEREEPEVVPGAQRPSIAYDSGDEVTVAFSSLVGGVGRAGAQRFGASGGPADALGAYEMSVTAGPSDHDIWVDALARGAGGTTGAILRSPTGPSLDEPAELHLVQCGAASCDACPPVPLATGALWPVVAPGAVVWRDGAGIRWAAFAGCPPSPPASESWPSEVAEGCPPAAARIGERLVVLWQAAGRIVLGADREASRPTALSGRCPAIAARPGGEGGVIAVAAPGGVVVHEIGGDLVVSAEPLVTIGSQAPPWVEVSWLGADPVVVFPLGPDLHAYRIADGDATAAPARSFEDAPLVPSFPTLPLLQAPTDALPVAWLRDGGQVVYDRLVCR
jgi:hypothetical protein